MTSRVDYDKLRGGYYTPLKISEFISKWALTSKEMRVLEPSCGDGSFIKAATCQLESLGAEIKEIKKQIIGVELDGNEAKKASLYNATIINSDFFSYFYNNCDLKFDVVLGNPPFIRYQIFNKDYRDLAFKLMNERGFTPNKLTNIWVPFLALSAHLLNDNGKLGMVIPAELFQVDYASEIRGFLSVYFERLTIITFKSLLFERAQQEVVILLGEKKANNKGIQVIELDGIDDIEELVIDENKEYEIKELDHDNEKWIKYYLTNQEIQLMRKIKNNDKIMKITDLLDVNVGVVSGQNQFFILNQSKVNDFNLHSSVEPIIGRAEHVKGIKFNKKDFDELVKADKNVYIFSPEDKDYSDLTKEDKKYIDYGFEQEYNKGYKCRIRKRWFIVPKSWFPDAFMLRQVHSYPKIVLNETNATTTDTLHKIKFKDEIDGHRVAAAFINSVTFALSEITGRSYGGGVLTFEPGEVRKLLIPMKGSEELDLNAIDDCLRNNNIEEALKINDEILLKKHLGLSNEEILMYRNIWIKLRDRRINRKKG